MNVLDYTDVVWDWNGTLLDDASLCCEIMNQQLAARGLPALSMERYGAVFGFPVRSYYERVGFDFTQEPFEIAAREFIDIYEARRYEARLRAGAREVLQRLYDEGVRQHLLSAYSQHALQTFIDRVGLTQYFATVMGIEDHFAASKLHRGRELAQGLRRDNCRVLLVGDTDHDCEVAAEMGVACVLLPAGHQSVDRLAACGVTVLNGLEDLFG